MSMSSSVKTIVVSLAVLALGSVLTLWFGRRRQQTALSALTNRLFLSAPAQQSQATPEEFHLLPEPVARYLRLALRRPASHIRLAKFSQTGTLRTDVRSDRWMAFEADNTVVPSMGFVWNARVRIAPLLHVQVIDSLIGGNGSGQINLLSAITVASAAGTPEMDSGSLHRFLAEAVWYPTALMPSEKLHWTALDGQKALATLSHNGTTVSLEFRFDDTGEIIGIYSPGRWGSFDGSYKQLPWEGRFANYELRNNMLVPTEGEVGWYLDGEWKAVWKGQVTAFCYELTE